ncbi:bifunctional phosphopantothenoylcysteine decarboxylase/phosphopantothenate--cysteine ligase CoaBC [Christiangramia sabulilitoris]|uniref:Coenzyme A biosynthesis bifunctional protein CoaBC n=1 Tax=Christiangramia sabulilitoris TaxID=2583991 RepID=A0A550I7Q2_9FLAO|nr:bifunctional phosphopantothenoylcysteine decarboxylase/phosphopantothenate--cysteine ligase CoaBC [Christiangramia sabulilitoris]TRO67003.1 bifunctional phosphopantothenoylcysteine decarboxylase/phosphopantothenate--cysteine ligase CoaBC [Christiangramia sabulilitoris]
MSVLKGKKVLLGVTGGIAAFKTAALVRLFVKAGAEVQVVMTPASKEFITPLTLSTLSKNEVYSAFTDEEDENAQWNNHVELGLWADFMLIAPATASTLSKMASGNSDNFLLATYLSAKCPVFFAPAMDLDMYKHPSTKNSLDTLQNYGNHMIPAGTGELASGLHGEGRMAEPEDIIRYIESFYTENLPLKGRKIVITAGPTYEAIDPVRFIGNHSSGKMGFEIAKAAHRLGAEVILISGPTHLSMDNNAISVIRVTSTREMYEAAHKYYEDADVFVAAAAVSDYRPTTVADKKIKKNDSTLTLELTKTEDILASLGEKKSHQKLIGFALETNNEEENARKKLKKKNLDFIVLNSLNDEGAGFKGDTNKISIIYHDNKKDYGLKSKKEVAGDILNEIVNLFHA